MILIPALLLGAQVSSPSQFTLSAMGEIVDQDGIHLASNAWRAPDGRRWTVIHKEFLSSVDAEKYLDRQAATAATVTKRGNATDKEGKVVGRRIEVILRNDVTKGSPAVLRTNGRHFYEILSDSFPHISDFENAQNF